MTSVEERRTQWSARVEAPGMSRGAITVAPARFALDPAARQTLQIDTRLDRGSRAFQDATVVLTNAQTGREARLPVSIRNPGIVDPPKRIEVAAGGASGSSPVTLAVSSTVSGVAHGLAAPQRSEITTSEIFPTVQEAKIPVDIAPGTALYSAQVKPVGPEMEFTNAGRRGRRPRCRQGRARASNVTGTSLSLTPRTFDLRWSGFGGTDELRGIVLWYDGDRAEPAKLLASSVVEVTPAG